MNLIKDEKEAKGFPYFQLIALGSGVAVGTAIGDPTGISAGAIGVFGGWGLERFITPFISKRQTVRLFQWGIQASENISQRLENGEKFRDDGFFSETPTNRSKMDEAVESTLKKVMETTEEPKIKYMANLTENVHFDSDLDIDTYRRILKCLEELSYRQLCIVKLFINADRIDLDSLDNPNVTSNLSSILTDCVEVHDKGFINSKNPLMEKIYELYLHPPVNFFAWEDKPPKYIGFTDETGFSNILSENMYKFAKLDQIPDEDIDSILRELRSNS